MKLDFIDIYIKIKIYGPDGIEKGFRPHCDSIQKLERPLLKASLLFKTSIFPCRM